MSCARISGANWTRTRLIVTGSAEAEVDDNVTILAPNARGEFAGSFRHRDNNGPLPDRLTAGQCTTPASGRTQITFTRTNEAGTITTVYTGEVIPVTGSTVVLIRGTFRRDTMLAAGAPQTQSGDWETEKPT